MLPEQKLSDKMTKYLLEVGWQVLDIKTEGPLDTIEYHTGGAQLMKIQYNNKETSYKIIKDDIKN